MKVSIVTAVFNAAGTIQDTLDAVAAQTHQDREHIVVDGGSRDGTVHIIQKNQARLSHFVSEPDRGVYDAMNKGMLRARGDVIGFLNADDVYADPEVLTRVALAFEDPSVEACFGDLVYVTTDNCRVVRYWRSREHQRGSFARGWCPAHPTFYVRRSAVERLGPFDLSYSLAADTEFMLRYLECGGVRSVYIPKIQVRMRVGGATNKSVANIVRQNLEIFRALSRNGVPYSIASFVVHKVASRIWQRFAGRGIAGV